MHPAFSVIFLTTLIGAGQGLFLALFTGQVYSMMNLLDPQDSMHFYVAGSALALAMLVLGLIASVFHLGRPERAWRSATMWRTSWLSREVIALPIFMGLVFLYGLVHYMGWTTPLFSIKGVIDVDITLIIGLLGMIAAFALFICTAMIYASVRFLQEWHSPLTVINYTVFGLASGYTLAAAFSALNDVDLVTFFGIWAVIFTMIAMVSRAVSMRRNRRIKHKSSLPSAIGIRHPKVVQKAQGFMGGSFNTREFFHGRTDATLRMIKYSFIILTFIVPVVLLLLAYMTHSPTMPLMAFVVQYIGLLAERYYFFAEAKHPQNLYYQTMS